jgi:glutamyl/glutaminyl-tRNA synthetase
MIRTRIAPTPSGYLHAGNGMSFIVTWVLARAYEGKILLRIDDLDTDRMRPEYVEDIFRTLDWLGLDYDEGPAGVDDFLKNYSQHKRIDVYKNALENLKNTEGRVYACNCSRKKIKNLSINGLYPNICREKRLDIDGKDMAWRVNMPEKASVSFQEFDPIFFKNNTSSKHHLADTMGDFIVRQKNGLPAYQIASLVDDVHFNINFIVRGEDLLNSTAAQIYLAQQLGYDDFCKNTFFHHKLLKNTEGGKLSKSAGDIALKTQRENGFSPIELYKNVGKWLGFVEDITCLEDVLALAKSRIKLL